ncbi:integral membrane sensor signal transduction histidine kinase [Treponema brennaborense DSM 12168]|uniref:Integral membrane sensor signal transduction histidine kinase n=1 Tax=Treponema brennaborense (strain DSM 12168 / CIP 105900 / DD5/3) TaxID=906968 RepID=F4LLJ3_TREBD|nr:integral membrane sensor signal transduction histidine kinase [Treponema brennaborense DSM 12168]
MNSDNSTADFTPHAQRRPPSAVKRKPLYLIRILCVLLAAACAAAAGALAFRHVESGLLTGSLISVCLAVAIAAFACFRAFAETERYVRLYLEGNGTESVRRIRLHYSAATEKLLAAQLESSDEAFQQEENRRRAQYLALQNQINPHFLYNTLEAIRSEAVVAGLSTVADMSETLANFFRYTVSTMSETVTLADELKNVRDYFTIQRFRFGDRIRLHVLIPQDSPLQFYRLPKLILQPIVENAIIHGLEDRVRGGEITIDARSTPRNLILTVEDNGKGIAHDKLIEMNRQLGMQFSSAERTGKQRGIAVFNVNERLRLLYGMHCGLTYCSMPRIGTTVEIVLPPAPESCR